MKRKYLFLSLIIIALIIPAAYASEANGSNILSDNDGIDCANDNLKIESNGLIHEIGNNEDIIQNTEKIEGKKNLESIDDDMKNMEDLHASPESKSDEKSCEIIGNEKRENPKGDIYTEYSDYINLKRELLTYDFNLTESNTIYVNSSYSGDEELGTQSNPYKSIISAYNYFRDDSNSKTNIFLAKGLYKISKKMTLTKNLNLIGESAQNTIISGDGSYEIFYISPPQSYYAVSPLVNFVNLSFTGGSSYYGGAIYINESAVNFVNTIFKNNTATDYVSYYGQKTYPASGGAIYNDKGFVRIYNSVFESNNASGSQDAYAGAIFNDMGEITILNSKIIDNHVNATYGSGGAIYDYSGILVIYNSSISNNSIISNYSIGGGLCNWASHNVFIINSSFDGNKLDGQYTFGSAISNKGNILEVHNTTISNNQANGISDENGTLFNLNGVLNLANTTFSSNTVSTIRKDLIICLEDQMIISKAFEDELLVNLPSSYDLRDYGLVTAVRDQGGSGSCWAFTTIAAIESYLLKYENISYDLSENNMKNLMGIYGLNGTDWPDGGNHYISLAYLLRWSGPVNESDDPFSDIDTSSKTKLNLTKHVQDVLFIPVRLSYLDLNQIKYALMTYGALYTTMQADNSFQYEPDYYHDVIDNSNHAVTLIGWDDNYPAEKFAVRPPGNGAFIIKNSWGTDHGYDGYWYISYYDKAFAGFGMDTISAMAITNVENSTNYKNIYQYDILGNTFESIGFNSNTAWLANQFLAKNDNPLTAFGLYTYGDSEYLVNITVNGISKCIQEGIIKGAGYHTIKLNDFVELAKNDIFRIAVKLMTPGSSYPIAIESKREDYSSGASANPNESFISADGINWIDLADYKNFDEEGLKIIKFYQYMHDYELKEANVCLKAYTSGIADVYLHIKSNSTIYKKGDLIDIILTVSNEGETVSDLNISIGMDDCFSIRSFQIIKGSFNSDLKLWHLNSLAEGESSVLKLSLSCNQAKQISQVSFNFDYDGFQPSNITKSYMLNLYYEGNSKFLEIENKSIFSKSNEELTLSLMDQNLNPISNKEIIISLLENESIGNNIKFSPIKLISDENGSAKFTMNLLEGNYKFFALFNGDSFYNGANATFSVNVSKRESPHIIIENTLINNSDEFKVLLIDKEFNPIAGKSLRFILSLNNKTVYTFNGKTSKDGEAKLTGLSKLNNGDYYIKILFSDDEFKDISLDKKITIKKDASKSSQKSKTVKTSKKATKLFVSKKTFKAKKKVKKLTAVLKTGKKAIKGKKIIFTINKKRYVAKTNKKGVATVKIKLSKKKTYKLIVKFAGDKYYKASKRTSKVVIK